MKLSQLSTAEFIQELSSSSPAPGGGSVAALAGALSASLCAMVSRLTIGKKKYREAWETMKKVINKSEGLTERFLVLMDEDTQAYNQVVTAMRLPRETKEQTIARNSAIQQATKNAALIPLETLKAVAELAGMAQAAVEKGNSNCITDAGTAVQLVRTAALAAAYNVRINIGAINDKNFVDRCSREVDKILSQVDETITHLERKLTKALI